MFPEDILIFLVSLQELQELIIKDGKGGLGTFCDKGVLHLQVNSCACRTKVVIENARKWWHLLFSTLIITVFEIYYQLVCML